MKLFRCVLATITRVIGKGKVECPNEADFVILKNEAFRREEFGRRQQVDFLGKTVYVVSPEDLLISKLIWIQGFQSSLQMEDIKNLSGIETLDWSYITTWIKKLNLKLFDLFKI